ncbi:hypothetical protein SAMN05444920_1464 [Nonomuraea solani]|uniref:Uncharacterized protein n=1 Tax=Nonomuraea solani TaxID=1144553 RepID=A0A1H6F3N8_9ACTN|nr:hypothetical protein [Nonomuraea solani]SEH03859.1 hypothetical protein SAMN05444920_1464 [Nonomuraea solani]
MAWALRPLAERFERVIRTSDDHELSTPREDPVQPPGEARFRPEAVVHGRLHIPRTTWHDGARFEETSIGLLRQSPPSAGAGVA